MKVQCSIFQVSDALSMSRERFLPSQIVGLTGAADSAGAKGMPTSRQRKLSERTCFMFIL
jgi:hypothetical protein